MLTYEAKKYFDYKINKVAAVFEASNSSQSYPEASVVDAAEALIQVVLLLLLFLCCYQC
jgi:hypothetical protein